MDSGGGPPRRATASVAGGAAPAVGDRVVLEGLVSRSDLNGKIGVLSEKAVMVIGRAVGFSLAATAAMVVLGRTFSAQIYDWIIIKMTKVWYRELIKRLPEGARVLDVGIGTGTALLSNADAVLAKKLEWIGLDVDRSYVRHCNESLVSSSLRDHASAALASIYDEDALIAIKKARAGTDRFSLSSGSKAEPLLFDCVYFSGSFSLLPDPEQALRMAKSALKPGGRIFITQTFQHKAPPLFGQLKPLLKYLTTIDFGRLFFARQVEGIVRDSGLTLVSMEPIEGSVDNTFQTAYIVAIST